MAVESFWHHFWTFNISELFECFCFWNHCFLILFFWKNHQVYEGQRHIFRQKFFVYLSQEEIALKFAIFCEFFEKFKLLISLDWSLLEDFWGHFWAFYVFRIFATKIIGFDDIFLEKSLSFWGAYKPFDE